jgi:hypothetical protein
MSGRLTAAVHGVYVGAAVDERLYAGLVALDRLFERLVQRGLLLT